MSKTQMDELVLSCETIQDSKSETKTKTVTTKTETKTKALTLKTKTETVKILSQDCLETRQCLETSHHCLYVILKVTNVKISYRLPY